MRRIAAITGREPDWSERVRPTLPRASVVCRSIVIVTGRVYGWQVGQPHGHEVGPRLLCGRSTVANSTR